MDLKSFFMALDTTQREQFAFRCNTSRQHITNLAYNGKTVGADLAVNIDRESKGVVTVEELRPDIDWKHLRARWNKRKAA